GGDRCLQGSSVATWGCEPRPDLDADAPPRPRGVAYMATKGASDALVLARANDGEPVAVVRPGDVYGPGSTPWAVRPLEGMRRHQFMLVGTGEGIMTPVYVDDLVEAIVLALLRPDARGPAFTVCDGERVAWTELLVYS